MLLALPSELLEHHILRYLSVATATSLLFANHRIYKIVKRSGKLKSILRKDIYVDIFKIGAFDLWKWFQNFLCYPTVPSLILQNRCLKEAAKGGHLVILKLALKNRYTLEDTVMDVAALHGQLQILEHLHSELGGQINAKTFSQAAIGGQIETMEWLLEHGCTMLTASASAAKHGQLNALKWLKEHNAPVNSDVALRAATNGHLDVLIWASQIEVPMNHLTCAVAALGGHLEVLKWLHAQKVPWTASACAMAAEGGHLEVLKYLRSEGCPWDAELRLSAFLGRNAKILSWARENGYQW